MSFDELPPDSTPPRRKRNVKPSPEQEATPSDAPPSKPARRRRAQPDGTDAASASSASTPESPVRKPQTRRKSVSAEEQSLAAPETTMPQPEPTSPAEGATTTEQTPAPLPRRRRAVKSVRPDETVSTEATDMTVEASPPESSPQSGVRRRRTPKAEEPTIANAAETEPAPAPKRRRTSRTAKEAVATEETVAESTASDIEQPATAEQTTPPDTETETALVSEQDTVEPTKPEESEIASPELSARPVSRNRRQPRSRRSKPPIPEAPAVAVSTDEELEVETETPDETESEEETPTVETPQGRSRRRRSRSRRSEAKSTVPRPEAPVVADARQIETPVVIVEPPVEKIDLTVGAHLVAQPAGPEIHIHGVVYPPVLFFGNLEGDGNRQKVLSEVRRAARAGVHLHSVLLELPCPLTEATHALDTIDDRLRALLEADPDGYLMPRIVFVPARGWKREYPTEIAAYTDGTSGDPSITSERFWQEAERSLTTLINHLREYTWGKRIFCFHLEHGEWFQPAGQGYDRSTANRDAFRDWLRDKYKHNLIALRAAWYDGDVQFHTAEIPGITKPNPQRAFFETRRERNIIDFNEFTSESTARRIIMLARAVKKATQNQVLVSVCYGYTLEFGHPSSGHLALSMLESAPEIDLICGPPSYRDRKPGGTASYPSPFASPLLYGKLWLSEDDTKTYLAPTQQAPDDFNPRLGDRSATEQAHARAQGRALACGSGVGWMDLWGEGWLDDENLWNRLGVFTAHYRNFLAEREKATTPDVVVLVDEKSLLHIQRGEPFFRKLTNGVRDTLERSGVSFGTYLQSDLLAPNFPTTARLYLFMTPFRLTTEQRAAIKEKLQHGGKTLVWLYAPGACEERPSIGGGMEEAATGAVGLTLRQQPWNSEVGSRISEPYHLVTERMSSREFGIRERLNPSYFVDDTDATVLAEYLGSNLPSMAVRDFGTWKTVFVGEPGLPLELLRGICRYAGVPVWTPQGEDVVSVGNGWVSIHAARDGQRTLYLPEITGIYDVTDSRLIADEAREHRFFLRSGMTKTFCIGSTDRFLRLGLPNVTLPGSERAKIVLNTPGSGPAPRREPSTLSAPLRADLETLEAVLTVDVSLLEAAEEDVVDAEDDLDIDDDLAGDSEGVEGKPGTEAGSAPRRRRRRGGRGRGRRRSSVSTDILVTPVSSAEQENASPPENERASPATDIGIIDADLPSDSEFVAGVPDVNVEATPLTTESEAEVVLSVPETDIETLLPVTLASDTEDTVTNGPTSDDTVSIPDVIPALDAEEAVAPEAVQVDAGEEAINVSSVIDAEPNSSSEDFPTVPDAETGGEATSSAEPPTEEAMEAMPEPDTLAEEAEPESTPSQSDTDTNPMVADEPAATETVLPVATEESERIETSVETDFAAPVSESVETPIAVPETDAESASPEASVEPETSDTENAITE